MMNVNIGGTKAWKKIPKDVQARWKVLDVAGTPDYKYDLNSGTFLPFKDGVIDNYYCSHTLEHVKPEVVLFLLEQIHRTLKKGGKIRIVVPDVMVAAKRYVAGDRSWLRKNNSAHAPFFPPTALGDFMTWFYSQVKGYPNTKRAGHHMAFDAETLRYYLCKVGFTDVTLFAYNEGSAAFHGLDFPRYKDISVYMEATK
jgi:predicted SAM-dependent methyltransferase